MNPDGQVYFDHEMALSDEDRERYERAIQAELEEKQRRLDEAIAARLVLEESEAAERARMLDEGGHE